MKKKIRFTKNFMWKECLAMYKWVAARWLLTGIPVSKLKERWLKAHGYKKNTLVSNCFFCEYDVRSGDSNCAACPAILIDSKFLCDNSNHCWHKKPVEFYLEIERLNKIRCSSNNS